MRSPSHPKLRSRELTSAPVDLGFHHFPLRQARLRCWRSVRYLPFWLSGRPQLADAPPLQSVDIDSVSYVVKEMHLLSTIFRRTDGVIVQAPHNVLNTKSVLFPSASFVDQMLIPRPLQVHQQVSLRPAEVGKRFLTASRFVQYSSVWSYHGSVHLGRRVRHDV